MGRRPTTADYDRITLYFKSGKGGKQGQVYKMLKTLAGSTTDIITSVFSNVLGGDLWLDFEHMERGDIQEMIMRHLFELNLQQNQAPTTDMTAPVSHPAVSNVTPTSSSTLPTSLYQNQQTGETPRYSASEYSDPIPAITLPKPTQTVQNVSSPISPTNDDDDFDMPSDDDSDIPVDDGTLAQAFPGI